MGQRKLEGFEGTKVEALVETMLLAARADGEFSAEERTHFAESVQSLTDRTVADAVTEAMIVSLEHRITEEGRAARLLTLKDRLGEGPSRAIALELAVALMAADGILRTAERELVMEVAEALEIDPDAAADIVARNHP